MMRMVKIVPRATFIPRFERVLVDIYERIPYGKYILFVDMADMIWERLWFVRGLVADVVDREWRVDVVTGELK